MFDNFSEATVRTLMLAQTEGRIMRADKIGTEHYLIGIMGESKGMVAGILREEYGVVLKEIRVMSASLFFSTSKFTAIHLPFSVRMKYIFDNAKIYAEYFQQSSINPEHLVLAMLAQGHGNGLDLLEAMDVDIFNFSNQLQDATAEMGIQEVYYKLKYEYEMRGEIADFDLREKIIRPPNKIFKRALEYKEKKEREIREKIRKLEEEIGRKTTIKDPVGGDEDEDDDEFDIFSLSFNDKYALRKNTLKQFTTNLTEKAENEDEVMDPVIGRRREIYRVMQILTRRRKNNPILLGEAGVGKTAVSEGLAQSIASKKAPTNLAEKQVILLNLTQLLAGTKYRGEFEERLRRIIDEITSSQLYLLVIDEIHTLVGAGNSEGALDAANILKPPLARGTLQCIGATTPSEYKQSIERDLALERRFQAVTVAEPTLEETILILAGLRKDYEAYHQVHISNKALASSAKLSAQYVADRSLPDKAIDLMDEACARVRINNSILPKEIYAIEMDLQLVLEKKIECMRFQDFETAIKYRNYEMKLRERICGLVEVHQYDKKIEKMVSKRPSVGEGDVAKIVATWTGIPVNKVTEDERKKLIMLEQILGKEVIGQERAVKAISKAIRRARTGLQSTNRPIASFLFSGPTGVGKTELTKTLARHYFGSEDSMVRIDMSEYMEKHTVAKLIGAPPGYIGYGEGGQLTEAVRRRPYSLILLDEVEKGHPDVFNLLLQILEDGRLTDAKGLLVNFKNTIIILTSNLGSSAIQKMIEKGQLQFRSDGTMDDKIYKKLCDTVNRELLTFFRPEFINRLDETIVFRPLAEGDLLKITRILLRQLNKRLQSSKMELKISSAAIELIMHEGYEPAFGARPLRRAITRLLEDEIATLYLAYSNKKDRVKEVDDTQVKEPVTDTKYLTYNPDTNISPRRAKARAERRKARYKKKKESTEEERLKERKKKRRLEKEQEMKKRIGHRVIVDVGENKTLAIKLEKEDLPLNEDKFEYL